MRRLRTAVAPLAALAALGLAAGCGSDDEPVAGGTGAAPQATAPAATTGSGGATTTTDAATTTVVAYLLRDGDVAPVARAVGQTEGVGAAAVRALLAGPSEDDAGLTTEIPAGTELNGLAIADGLATVDLSARFAEDADQASLLARIAQVVHTLTRFETVQRVAFAIDGHATTTIGEVVTVDPPLARADVEDQAPQILIESPLPNAAVSSPLRVTGTANTFEATFALELRDAGGNRLAQQIVTATSGSGTRGTFDATLAFDAPAGGAIELYAYEPSAEDGSPLHEVRIPLRAG